ncbi:hypothetical protein TrVFT333_004725 [Trichoderma virens FT-333]|nr:hypothetical protein TrVFT333_004725 [Trichoderma virens FT-333]
MQQSHSEEKLQEAEALLPDPENAGFKHNELRAATPFQRVARLFNWTGLVHWTLHVSFVLTIVAMLLGSRHGGQQWNESDFITVKKEFRNNMSQVRFTAGLKFNSTKQLYRPIYPNQTQYVGEASKEIDDAWDDIIGAVNVFVLPSEEDSLGGGLYFQPDSKLFMGQPTVFHDLHCLNRLRRNMPWYFDYYDHRDDTQAHMDHCIDSLRQSLMCTSDMTVAPIIWSYEKGRIIPDFEIDHSCRDFETLKEWALARDSADPERYPQNAERLHKIGH